MWNGNLVGTAAGVFNSDTFKSGGLYKQLEVLNWEPSQNFKI